MTVAAGAEQFRAGESGGAGRATQQLHHLAGQLAFCPELVPEYIPSSRAHVIGKPPVHLRMNGRESTGLESP